MTNQEIPETKIIRNMHAKADNRFFERLDEVIDNSDLDDKHREICSFLRGVCSKTFDEKNLTVDNIGIWNKKLDQVFNGLIKTDKPA